MSTENIIAAYKEKAMRRYERDLDILLGELEAQIRQEVTAEQLEVITNTVMTKRKKIAETEEVALERGMTIEEIKLHNAEVEGWNKRGTSLRKRLLGTEEVVPAPVVEPTPEPTPEPAPAEPEPAPAG